MRWVMILAGILALLSAPNANAWAQDVLGGSDTLFTTLVRNPLNYTTSYDRDVSTGTWTQALSYGFSRPRVVLSTNGSYATVDQIGRRDQNSGSGSFSGRLDLRAAKNWYITADGKYNKSSTHDPSAKTLQRQNRLKLSSQYSVSPRRNLGVQAQLFSEFQVDHSLALRQNGTVPRYLVIRNPQGDSVGVDTLNVQRDSTKTTGRQDGVSGLANWKPNRSFEIVATASGTRVRPATTSHLGGFEPGSTLFEQRLDKNSGSAPNDNYQYLTKMTYRGPRGLQALVTLNRSRSDQAYYDRTALRQELFSSDQRSGTLHLEQAPLQSLMVTFDGSLSRSLGEYRFRNNQNNLVSSKASKVILMFNPSVLSRGSLEFDVNFNRNSRQQFGNGTNVSRFLQATAAHRLTRRLSLDGVATASLTSFQYVDSTSDQDNARAYVNVGTGYQVSERCSTQVHFSVSKGHSVALDPSQSSNNNIQTTYQMDALMKLGVTPRLSISQIYLLNALYQIYDFPSAESRNVLSRIRRIDTIVSDSLFQFATLQLVHNFLFRDFGSFTRLSPEADRAYRVFSQTYVQTVSATLNLKPVQGVLFSATQGLSNTRIASSSATTVNNHWNLTLGATVDRTIMGDMSLTGSVQHISAYDEIHTALDQPNRDDYWIAGVTVAKSF